MSTEELWEVEVGTEQYQADLDTIKLWIREGRIKPTDRVRKGSLNWTRVSLVPQLRGITADAGLIANLAVQHIRREIPEIPVGERSCEACAETILSAAFKCRYCGTVSIRPEWREFYSSYMSKDEKAKDAYQKAMKESEREYFNRLIDFLKAEAPARKKMSDTSNAAVQKLDNSTLAGYYYYVSNSSNWKTIFARDEYQARELIARDLPQGVTITKISAIGTGKFSCPRCGNRCTACNRDIGCAIMIIIFISFGLGLIMIPFLPHKCSCMACGYRWKA